MARYQQKDLNFQPVPCNGTALPLSYVGKLEAYRDNGCHAVHSRIAWIRTFVPLHVIYPISLVDSTRIELVPSMYKIPALTVML